MLPVERRWGIGVADVAARPVAGPAIAIVPATRVLRDVATDGSLVPNLRRRRGLRSLQEDGIVGNDFWMTDDLCQRGHRPDLQTTTRLPDLLQLVDGTQVDDSPWSLHAILEPIEAVEPAGHRPSLRAISIEQGDGVVSARGLIELKRRHRVTNHGHGIYLPLKRGPPSACAETAPTRASSESCQQLRANG